jgi:hypothetical protein
VEPRFILSRQRFQKQKASNTSVLKAKNEAFQAIFIGTFRPCFQLMDNMRSHRFWQNKITASRKCQLHPMDGAVFSYMCITRAFGSLMCNYANGLLKPPQAFLEPYRPIAKNNAQKNSPI